MTQNKDNYFWIDENSEVEPVTKEQFEQEIENERERERKWREVDLD